MMSFDRSNIRQLHLETSSVCNAACPMCPREIDPNFDKEKDGMSLSLIRIQELFDVEFIKRLESMFMCGNYGDPAAAPECIDIMRYFRQVNNNVSLGIHSNGSLRTKKWWSELGNILSRDTDYCYFGIDGLKDTNHLHRVNTTFEKIIENASAFIESGGKAHWEYLVFQHNEHQVEEARALAHELGFTSFREKVSRRFKLFPNTGLFPPIGEQYQ